MYSKICALSLLCWVIAADRYRERALSYVDNEKRSFWSLEANLWNQLHHLNESGKEEAPEVYLISEFEKFGDHLDKHAPYDLDTELQVLESSWLWADINSRLRGVYALYETFRRFQRQQTTPGRIASPKEAWLDLISTIMSDPNFSVPKAIQMIGGSVDRAKLFLEAIKVMDKGLICNEKQSPKQLLYNLYKIIAITELKGYMMIQFSYMLTTIYGNDTKMLADKNTHLFHERSLKTSMAVEEALAKVAGELYTCDPKNHIEGKTYLQFTQLLQGYIQNEVDLNNEGTCRENCAAYTYTKSHNCYQNLYCQQQRRCNGQILGCRFVDSDMWICPTMNASAHRRYEYVEYENGRVLGRKQNCPAGRVKVDSWWRWLFWHCSYCMCLCDEEGPHSDRYISLRSSESNVKLNRVVTGLSFVKKNRIIHIQIQEGKLLPMGLIDKDSVQWVPVDDMRITDPGIFRDTDYLTLSWERRTLDLDDLQGENGQVVIGVRFKKLGTHVNFEVLVTPFDFETGKLIEPIHAHSVWKDNLNTELSAGSHKRTEVKIESPDVPIRQFAPSSIDSTPNQFVQFTHTDFDKDAAQTTVPFFDAQPVVSAEPSPLSGAGIYHKGQSGFGGFVGLKIFTYDYSDRLLKRSDIAPTDYDEDTLVN